MGKVFCVSLVFVLLFSCLFTVCEVHASTPVSGLITSDTVWTKDNSPYELTGPMCVLPKVTLTIEPGVMVNFQKYYLQINGTLNARGTSDKIFFYSTYFSDFFTNQRIEFMSSSDSWDEQTGSGCIIENAVFNVATVTIKDCAPKISGNIFSNLTNTSIEIDGGAPKISHNTIHSPPIRGSDNTIAPTGIVASGYAIVSNNFIDGISNGIFARGYAYIVNNRIINCFTGINSNENAVLEGNVVANCKNRGISGHGESVKISHNYIANNSVGIYGKGIIKSNTITDNNVGIENPGWPFTNNNIVGSRVNSVLAENSYDINAANNWWGTTDIDAINQTIRDFKNDFRRGVIRFDPILTQPSSSAPTSSEEALLIRSTAPSPSPQSSSTLPNNASNPVTNEAASVLYEAGRYALPGGIIILLVLFVVLVLVPSIKHKERK